MFTANGFEFEDLGGASFEICEKVYGNKQAEKQLRQWLKENYIEEYAAVASDIEREFSIAYISDQISEENGQRFLDELEIFIQSTIFFE